MAKVSRRELFAEIPRVDENFYRARLAAALKNFSRKVIVQASQGVLLPKGA